MLRSKAGQTVRAHSIDEIVRLKSVILSELNSEGEKERTQKYVVELGKFETSACGASRVDIQIIKVKLCGIFSCNLL